MTPNNLSNMASIREWQKYFNQVFNLSAASTDLTYASTQTITGGLIICRNFKVNSGVTLTISNPTTIVCESFTNAGTITMSPVTFTNLGRFRRPIVHSLEYPTESGSASVVGKGWDATVSGMPLWWVHALFANPITERFAPVNNAMAGVQIAYQRPSGTVLPGSFIEIFSRGSVNNNSGAFISANGATTSAVGGGGGGVCIYSETSLINAGTLFAKGGDATGGGGSGGGGAIFTMSPILSNTGTISAAGGGAAGGTAGSGGPSYGSSGVLGTTSNAGIVMTTTYSRLWMPGEDDTLTDLRYPANGT